MMLRNNCARWLMALLGVCLAGCAAPKDHLTFPRQPLLRNEKGWFYDVNGNGKPDFALLFDTHGRLNTLAYDDRENGSWNRQYRLSDYANADVPHLIVLLDSIPYEIVRQRYDAGDFRWFDPPTKVIPPFPTLTELIFTDALHAPPMPAFIDRHYDRSTGKVRNIMTDRAFGYLYPWEQYLDFKLNYLQFAFAYLHPREWTPVEYARILKTFNAKPTQTTLAYDGVSSAMLCRFGKQGAQETLDGFEQLCLQALYERHGAVKISAFADHGHNLTPSKNVYLEPTVQAAGFHITDKLRGPKDVYVMLDGLVTVMGIYAADPSAVAQAVVKRDEVQLAIYLDQDRVVVRNTAGSAIVERRGNAYRYRPLDADVIGYAGIIESLKARGKVDADGYIAQQDWFDATLDAEYPEGPKRLWDALHGMVLHPCDVIVTLKDGYCAGEKQYEKYIQMASTHGGLNQVNSATFLMTMTGRADHPLRSREIMGLIAPGYEPTVQKR